MRFCWKDYAHGNRVRTMTLSPDEFLRRFLLHVLPAGLVRIRHFGFLANRGRRAKLARCRALLAVPPAAPTPPESIATPLHRLTGVDITQCPVCRARIAARGRIPAWPFPDSRPGHFMNPPLACRPGARRAGRVCPPRFALASQPGRAVRLPIGPPPVAPGVPPARVRKTLSSATGFRYNPHSP